MRLRTGITTLSLSVLAAIVAIPVGARAGCTPSVNSDARFNTCIGTGALRSNADTGNTAIGSSALASNTSAGGNTAIGHEALYSNTVGHSNTAIGRSALVSSTVSMTNVAIGVSALRSGGEAHTALGAFSLASDTMISDQNTAIGYAALHSNIQGYSNTAIGKGALMKNTFGSSNVAIGQGALQQNTAGSYNTAVGVSALNSNLTGKYNTAVGSFAGFGWVAGENNIALGAGAGKSQTGGGSGNIAIGAAGEASDNGIIRIGTVGVQKRAFIAGIFRANITGGLPVLVDAYGQIAVAKSSRRYKQDIKPMGDASDKLMQLQPVTFHYKEPDQDGQRPLQYGLIAEDVAAVMPALAIYGAEGEPESVAYHMLPSLLLNEYQKQNRKLMGEEAKLAALQAEAAETRADVEAIKHLVSRLAAGAPAGLPSAELK